MTGNEKISQTVSPRPTKMFWEMVCNFDSIMTTNKQFQPVDEQLAYLRKGAAEIIRDEDLRAKLEASAKTGKPLRVYLGVDPTAPDIHLGHTVVLRKLKHFQDMGHTAIFLIGDFSA